MAISVSRKTTSRSEAKTRYDQSVNSRRDNARADTWLTAGMIPGARVAALLSTPKSLLDSRSSSSRLRQAGSGARSDSSSRRVLLLVSTRSVCGNQ
jgi:hypothetical protein